MNVLFIPCIDVSVYFESGAWHSLVQIMQILKRGRALVRDIAILFSLTFVKNITQWCVLYNRTMIDENKISLFVKKKKKLDIWKPQLSCTLYNIWYACKIFARRSRFEKNSNVQKKTIEKTKQKRRRAKTHNWIRERDIKRIKSVDIIESVLCFVPHSNV